jgi:hypothetical protein
VADAASGGGLFWDKKSDTTYQSVDGEIPDANFRAAELVAATLRDQGFDARATYREETRHGYDVGGGGAYSYTEGTHEVEVSWGKPE